MKPLLKYRGGKSRELSRILPLIPPFEGRYIEPFFGGGAVYFALEPRLAIINDINSRLMDFYREVCDNFGTLRRDLDRLEEIYTVNRRSFDRRKAQLPETRVADDNEELYYHLRDVFNGLAECEYSDAAVYYFINKTAYSGMIRYNTRREFNVPFGRYPNFNTSGVSFAHSELLQRTQIFDFDYAAVFAMARPDDFVFLDPPYDCVFSDYGNEEYADGFKAVHHQRLAESVRQLPCPWLMVIGKTPLTEELYDGLIIDEYGKSYSVNIRNRFKSQASHLVVANYRPALADLFQLENN